MRGKPWQKVALTQATDERELMEIEVRLETLRSLLVKSEQYANKLRMTLVRISERLSQNRDRLQCLLCKREDMMQNNQLKQSYMNRIKQSQVNLYAHRIQGIPFYQFEQYIPLDCAQAFELISKKKHLHKSTVDLDEDNNYSLSITSDQKSLIKQFCSDLQNRKVSSEQIKASFIMLIANHLVHKTHSKSEHQGQSNQNRYFEDSQRKLADANPNYQNHTANSTASMNGQDKCIDWLSLARLGNWIIGTHQELIRIEKLYGLELFSAWKNKQDKNASSKMHGDSSSSVWSREEDLILMKSVRVFGEKQWGQIQTQLNGREHSGIVQRWVKFLNPGIEKGRWSLREDFRLGVLQEFYAKNKFIESKTWCVIASHFSNRTEVQIRERWCNLLDPKIKFTTWTRKEDQLLLTLATSLEGQWAKISRHLENKTDNQVLRRWKLLLSDRFNINLLKNIRINSNSITPLVLFNTITNVGANDEKGNQCGQSGESSQSGQSSESGEFYQRDKGGEFKVQDGELAQRAKDGEFDEHVQDGEFDQRIKGGECKVQDGEFTQCAKGGEFAQCAKGGEVDEHVQDGKFSEDEQGWFGAPNQMKLKEASNQKQYGSGQFGEKKFIFKVIKLTASLADQVRRDNCQRRENKKKSIRKRGGKKNCKLAGSVIQSVSQIDNTSTFRSIVDEEEIEEEYEQEEITESGVNFTELQSESHLLQSLQ